MSDIKDATFVRQVYSLVGRREDDASDLPIYVTPYMGSNGPAGVVITVFGTPPRATLVVPLNGAYRIYSAWGDPKAIEEGTPGHDAILAFLSGHGFIANQAYIAPLPGKLDFHA